MSNLNISVDMGRVQSSVQAAIRPAVESALAEYDLQAGIREVLFAKVKSGGGRGDWMMMRFLTASEPATTTLLDNLVKQGISDIAKQFVERELRGQQPDIEEALRKMMAGSTSALVKKFAKAAGRALEEDWGFELAVKVEHTVAEAERDDG
jgi:hypothetical protein